MYPRIIGASPNERLSKTPAAKTNGSTPSVHCLVLITGGSVIGPSPPSPFPLGPRPPHIGALGLKKQKSGGSSQSAQNGGGGVVTVTEQGPNPISSHAS